MTVINLLSIEIYSPWYLPCNATCSIEGKGALGKSLYDTVRIGHTHYYLRHSYLIEHTYPPKCSNCNQLLSVKLILTECTSYGQTRHQYY